MSYERGYKMQHVSEAVTSVKTAGAVAAATITTGLSTWIDLIPDNIGKLASLAGLLLSFVLICVHIHAAWLRHKKNKNID